MEFFWHSPSKPIKLAKEGEVHIWCAILDEVRHNLVSLWKILDRSEQDRALRFVYKQHQIKFIIAHGVLRKLISGYLQIDPVSIVFQQNDYGKPEITCNDSLNLKFNLSHSHDLALFAFSINNSIGVDIEFIKDKIDFIEIAQRFFAEQEVANILAMPDEGAKKQAFFNCWARKEAVLKAIGKGLSFSLDKVAVDVGDVLQNQVQLKIKDPEYQNQPWSLFALQPCANYAAALAVEGKVSFFETFLINTLDISTAMV